MIETWTHLISIYLLESWDVSINNPILNADPDGRFPYRV